MPAECPHLTLDHVRHALQRSLPGQAAHAPMMARRLADNEPLSRSNGSQGRDAAVLVLVYESDNDLYVILTRRTEWVQSHKGQISFPGGAREGNEPLVQTALREANEELGIANDGIEVLGTLTPVYVSVSDYLITPVVAVAAACPHLCPDPIEVSEAIEVPLSALLDHRVRQEEIWTLRGVEARVPFFAIGRHKVWGATAMILAELAALLEAELATRQETELLLRANTREH